MEKTNKCKKEAFNFRKEIWRINGKFASSAQFFSSRCFFKLPPWKWESQTQLHVTPKNLFASWLSAHECGWLPTHATLLGTRGRVIWGLQCIDHGMIGWSGSSTVLRCNCEQTELSEKLSESPCEDVGHHFKIQRSDDHAAGVLHTSGAIRAHSQIGVCHIKFLATDMGICVQLHPFVLNLR